MKVSISSNLESTFETWDWSVLRRKDITKAKDVSELKSGICKVANLFGMQ